MKRYDQLFSWLYCVRISDVHGERDAVMTEHRRERLIVHPFRERDRGERMPDVVEPHGLESAALQHPLEHREHAVRVLRSSLRRREEIKSGIPSKSEQYSHSDSLPFLYLTAATTVPAR